MANKVVVCAKSYCCTDYQSAVSFLNKEGMEFEVKMGAKSTRILIGDFISVSYHSLLRILTYGILEGILTLSSSSEVKVYRGKTMPIVEKLIKFRDCDCITVEIAKEEDYELMAREMGISLDLPRTLPIITIGEVVFKDPFGEDGQYFLNICLDAVLGVVGPHFHWYMGEDDQVLWEMRKV